MIADLEEGLVLLALQELDLDRLDGRGFDNGVVVEVELEPLA